MRRIPSRAKLWRKARSARCAHWQNGSEFAGNDLTSFGGSPRHFAGNPATRVVAGFFGSLHRYGGTMLGSAHKAELLQSSDPIVEADFLHDFFVPKLQYRRSRELHLPAGIGRQRSHQEVAECGSGVRSAAFPTADNVVALRDEIRSAPEIEVGECRPEIRHECLDVIPALARLMQRVPQEHIGRSEFIDNSEVAGLTPEIGEPATHDSLVVIFSGHD